MNIKISSKLNQREKTWVKAFQQDMQEKNHLFFKLDPQIFGDENGNYHHICCYEADELCGYACLACFEPKVGECTVLSTGPMAAALLSAAVTEAKKINCQTLQLAIDVGDEPFADYVKANGFQFTFAEHRMFFQSDTPIPASTGRLIIRDAVKSDRAVLSVLDEEALEAEGEFCIENYKTALLNDRIVARMRLEEAGDVTGIYGLSVHADLRGQGIGRELLHYALRQCQKKPCHCVYLEVETENAPALHLYQSVGFAINCTFSYYEANLVIFPETAGGNQIR